MRLATPAQALDIDRASAEYGATPELLMEVAGALAADRIARHPGGVMIACGPGHNGADGLVIARHLLARGREDVRIHLVAPGKSELFAKQLARAKMVGLKPGDFRLDGVGVIVDAMLGVGAYGGLSGAFADVVRRANARPAIRIAIDLPTGLDATTGVTELAFNAHETLTFGLSKPGFYTNEGPETCGRIRVLQPGFPRELFDKMASTHELFGRRELVLPPRASGANKTHFGHAMIVAGSEGKWGAGLLAADAAFRAGAGYVTWASFDTPNEEFKRIPEMMTAKLDDDRAWEKATALGIGPGLGLGKPTRDVLLRARKSGKPAVLDADALTAVAEHKLFPLPKNWIVTPHAGELSRLIDLPAKEIERDRFSAVQRAVEKLGGVVLLKGFRTVVGFEGKFRLINAGNVALAKAGTGDVLAGLITGLLARGLEPFDAAATGAYLHGRIADEWVALKDAATMRASDLIEALPRVLREVSS